VKEADTSTTSLEDEFGDFGEFGQLSEDGTAPAAAAGGTVESSSTALGGGSVPSLIEVLGMALGRALDSQRGQAEGLEARCGDLEVPGESMKLDAISTRF